MQAEGAIGPELDLHRADAEPAPEWRALGAGPCCAVTRATSAMSAARLSSGRDCARGPGAKPALERPGGEIGVRRRPVLPLHWAAHADLAAQAFPVHHEGRLARGRDLPPLGAVVIGVEHEGALARPAASISFSSTMRTLGRPVGIDAGQRDGVGIVDLGLLRLRKPRAGQMQTDRRPRNVRFCLPWLSLAIWRRNISATRPAARGAHQLAAPPAMA
jgi:hypothetical protein